MKGQPEDVVPVSQPAMSQRPKTLSVVVDKIGSFDNNEEFDESLAVVRVGIAKEGAATETRTFIII